MTGRTCAKPALSAAARLLEGTGVVLAALIGLLAGPSLVNRVRRMVLLAPFLSVVGLPFSMKGVRRIANGLMRSRHGSFQRACDPAQR